MNTTCAPADRGRQPVSRRRFPATPLLPLVAFVGLLSAPPATAAEDLPRRGYLGARADFVQGPVTGAALTRVVPDSPAAHAGWQPGDIIVAVDGSPVADEATADRVTRRPPAGRPVQYRWWRAGARHESVLEFPEVPRETYRHASIAYGSLTLDDGRRVRTLFTRPQGPTPAPALLVVGWLSGASVEAPDTATDGSSGVFRGLIERSGFAVLRVEKPGVGDSEGVLARTDFLTELGAYRAALTWLRRQSAVDPTRIFILGTSNGGGIAPLVAEDVPVRGYLVEGAWARTWLEHMLAIERRRLTLLGHPPAQVNDEMRQVARLNTALLLEGRSPADLFAAEPSLRALWPDRTAATLYGRPPEFYRQLQSLNLAAAWSLVKVPVLAMHGEFDWVMDREEAELIVSCVNRHGVARAELLTLPRRGHTFSGYASLADAFADRELPFEPDVLDRLLDWLRRHQ